ncbi:MAG: hypothetical protein A2Y40_05260 [Candidatus Margulisbacteria bacterium GWF2_35_9]|nr:MAG: hypothetical protein A2Y40_05260 [Candidatus Margulisbacteria bacterium GWF2_35_9]
MKLIKKTIKFIIGFPKRLSKCAIETYRQLICSLTWKRKASELAKSQSGLQLHLGCGDKHFNGMLNCEFRATKAADMIMDCGNLHRFKDDSVQVIFSHAFFEHLYKQQQIILLRDCFRVLVSDGMVVFIGIPDFEVIADAYLKKLKGVKGPVFDLENVYRYSHGNPEMAYDFWLEQLHKSLFDKVYLWKLLKQAGLKNPVMFNYAYPGEDIPLNLGFIATKDSKELSDKEIKTILEPYKGSIKNMDELLIYREQL